MSDAVVGSPKHLAPLEEAGSRRRQLQPQKRGSPRPVSSSPVVLKHHVRSEPMVSS
jgi:hypothetical protein